MTYVHKWQTLPCDTRAQPVTMQNIIGLMLAGPGQHSQKVSDTAAVSPQSVGLQQTEKKAEGKSLGKWAETT